MPGFEVRYLNIVWENETTAKKVESSELPLELVREKSGYSVESIIYKKFQPYLAISVLDSNLAHAPYTLSPEGDLRELLSIIDPTTRKTWWIFSDGWDKKGQIHLSELYRTVGTVNVKVQKQDLLVRNNSSSFSVEELDAYLRDFKNDLWQIILDNSGHITGSIIKDVPGYVSEDVVHVLKAFTNSVEKVLKNPTIELRETQALVAPNVVRPINRTFMEIAAKGAPSRVTGRSFEESQDTAENRYLNYAVSRVLFLTKQLISIAKSNVSRSEAFEENETNRLKTLNDSKKVDKAVFDNELKDLSGRLVALESELVAAVDSPKNTSNLDEKTYNLCLKTKLDFGISGGYWSEYLDGDQFKQKYGRDLVVKLPEKFCSELIANSRSQITVKVTGRVSKTSGQFRTGREYYLLTYDEISSVQLVAHPLLNSIAEMRSRRSELDQMNWEVPYSPAERRDLENERAFIASRLKISRKNCESVQKYVSELGPILVRLKDLSKSFGISRVGMQSNFPNKMVFVQNPNYSTAKSTFFKLRDIGGLDEKTFESLMAVDHIGLVNISNLYEKWCLLKIIGTLTNVYGFQIEGQWQEKLISSVSRGQYNIEFTLSSSSLRKRVLLVYEKEMSSGKRPDFVLDISDFEGTESVRHVVDAKFKDHLKEKELKRLIQELYSPEGKNYSEGEKNSVFVLHVSPNVVKDRTSPLDWGIHSDYGQKDRHRFGAIYLCPSLRYGNTVHNLQRLIGQMLELSTHFSLDQDLRAIEHNAFCIACGNSDHSRLTVRRELTKGRNEKWNMQCMDCRHLHVRNVCASCGHTLYKNGQFWTYHRTRAEQPFNIVCPACQEFL